MSVSLPCLASSNKAVSLASLRRSDPIRFGDEDPAQVALLAEQDVTEWPPIVVHRATIRIMDGMHRFRATQRRGIECLEVDFFDGTEDEAFVRSVELNARHGLSLTMAERKAAAKRILLTTPEMSDRTIAGVTGLSARTVASVRKLDALENIPTNVRIGVDGRRRPADARNGRERVSRILLEHPSISLREAAARAGVSVGTAHSARKLMKDSSIEPEPPTPVPRATGRDKPSEDPVALLRTLGRDPAVRFSTSGRRLMRLLHERSVDPAEVQVLAEGLPEHCTPMLGRVARYQANVWASLAGTLDERERARES